MAIEEGKKAPAFSLVGVDKKGTLEGKVSLKDFAGKTVVVYFYPKDNTPGCTKQAVGFTELFKQFQKKDVVILGVSPDKEEAHSKFIKDFKIPYVLLCDPTKKMMEKYQAYGEKMMYGKTTIGVIRSTVVVGPDGKVLKHWRKVPKAADHPQKVLDYLDSLES